MDTTAMYSSLKITLLLLCQVLCNQLHYLLLKVLLVLSTCHDAIHHRLGECKSSEYLISVVIVT